jgi:hypothetical protein
MAQDATLVRASTFYTIDADADITDGETLVIAGKTYTFQTTLTDTDGNVYTDGTHEVSRANLVAAINLTGTAGTDYADSMTRNGSVFAVDDGVDKVTVYAHVPGTIGNTIPVTVGTSAAAVDNATLEGGTGNVGDFFDGLFALNQINSEVVSALRPFSVVEGGLVD